jgi:hypothetical protein
VHSGYGFSIGLREFSVPADGALIARSAGHAFWEVASKKNEKEEKRI